MFPIDERCPICHRDAQTIIEESPIMMSLLPEHDSRGNSWSPSNSLPLLLFDCIDASALFAALLTRLQFNPHAKCWKSVSGNGR